MGGDAGRSEYADAHTDTHSAAKRYADAHADHDGGSVQHSDRRRICRHGPKRRRRHTLGRWAHSRRTPSAGQPILVDANPENGVTASSHGVPVHALLLSRPTLSKPISATYVISAGLALVPVGCSYSDPVYAAGSTPGASTITWSS